MPYLKITTNKSIDAGPKHNLLKAASKMVAFELGKPEQYIMVSASNPQSRCCSRPRGAMRLP